MIAIIFKTKELIVKPPFPSFLSGKTHQGRGNPLPYYSVCYSSASSSSSSTTSCPITQ